MGLLVEIAKTTQREMAGKTKVKVDDKSWSFREGIILFPETRCPFCKEVVKSKAIWQVDVKNKRLLGQGVPVKGQPFKLDNPKHPHVFTSNSGHKSGTTCMGNAPDMMTALFGAYNPSSLADTSQLISTWFKGKYWEHDCQKVGTCCRCHTECGTIDERLWKDKPYCDQCWQYEVVPAQKAEAERARKLEAARVLAEAKAKEEGKKKEPPPSPLTLSALLGQPEAPRVAAPEIRGFRFIPSGAGGQVVVTPLEDVGPAPATQECHNCGRVVPVSQITDCDNEEDGHVGMCIRCHDEVT